MKTIIDDKKRRIIFWSIIAFMVAIILALNGAFYSHVSRLLYQESISQLDEINGQLFERLDHQLDIQWDYLTKAQTELTEKGSVTSAELQETFLHLEKDLAPSGKTMSFRAITSDGYYYTNEGRQGSWVGNSSLTDSARQSFLITNWLDNDNYMAFVVKEDEEFYVDGNKIERFVLLRSMTDMREFYHSSAFDNENIAYVVDSSGFILYQTGIIDSFDSFNGTNVFTYLKENKFPHISFDDMVSRSADGEAVSTDVKINGERFYISYNDLPEYDWGVLLVVSSDSVAVDTAKMVQSIVSIFLIMLVFMFAVIVVGMLFMIKIQKDRAVLKEKEANEAVLNEANRNLDQTNHELQIAQRETEKALEVARSATKAKSQFLANMSHDIRTPMNAIVGVTKLMEHDVNNPDKLVYYIEKLRHTGQYMLGLINDILDMSKIESGEVKLNLESIKMAEQVGQVESIIRSQCSDKNQELTVAVHEITHEYLIGDSIRLRQVFLNILSNAVKYTPDGGKIHMDITELPCEIQGYATVLTSVIDNGVGMSKEFQEHMFEPFAREKNSTSNKVGGAGLGLSITKNIIDLMGGTITVDSKLGEGSRFDILFSLPIDKDRHEVPSVGKILFVSSDDTLITNVRAALSNTDIELMIAANTDDAGKLLGEIKVDAIILSGYLNKRKLTETVETLRTVANGAKFIFCCDYAHKKNVRNTIVSSGVDGFIARPFFVENLITAIRSAQKKADGGEEDDDKKSLLGGKRFLCAEDNELNAEILEALLELHGATCVIYPNGAELVKAFETVKEGDYDAILMDVAMPIMNGLEATGEIRRSSNPLGKTIPILAMTANAFSSDAQACIDAGMDAHLAKPLDITLLERTLQEIHSLRRGR